jgi:acyl carrier protein|tara:strand:- start:121 stop:429 length:309 start_codon:yes stop_codon:yes gene_type:complete
LKQKINKEIATKLIFEGIKDYNTQVNKKNQLPISIELELFSENGVLDSLGLVNLIMSIEEQFEDYLDTSIVIADEKAMSQKNSPFQSVQSMADYLSKELQNI